MATYSVHELAELGFVSPRTIRLYIQKGLLPPVERHGVLTRYEDVHLTRLLAIRKLRDTMYQHVDLRAALDAMTPAQLAAFVSPSGTAPVDDGTWTTVPLIPGLRLQVQQPCSPLAQRLADEIARLYALP